MKLLLVDDHEPFARAVVAAFLEFDEVIHATTLAAARREQGEFDAILVDYDLPDGKGDLLVAEIRRHQPGQLIIAISAHEEGNAALLHAGADCACPKTQFSKIRSILDARAGASASRAPRPTALAFTAAGGPTNEDRSLIARPSWGLVVAVADGAGGTGAGGFAAQTAVDEIGRAVADARAPLSLAQLAELLVHIDAVLVESRTGGETTAVIAQLVGSSIVGAAVGDSGAVLVHIHSSMTDLTARQSRKPLLGSGCSTPTVFGPAMLGGLLLVASDGLIKYAPRAAFARAMAAPDLSSARDILLESVRLRSGGLQDDTTGVLVRA